MADDIHVTIKCSSGETFALSVNVKDTVKILKSKLSDLSNIPPDMQRIIYAGRILKDDVVLESVGIKDGVAIHMVKSKPPVTSSSSSPSPSPSSPSSSTPTSSPAAATSRPNVSPSPFPSSASTPPPINAANPFMPFGAQLPNEDMMEQMMNSPMMRQMMNNPDLLQSMMMANPQIRQITERNPELRSILENPEMIRQSMEIARNPELMREMMRTADLQMANLENLPGGFSHLQRMYHEIQEPLMNAVIPPDPNQTTTTPADTTPSRETNTAPLPNPWGGSASSGAGAPPSSLWGQPAASPSSSATGSASANPNPFGGMNFGLGMGSNDQREFVQRMLNDPSMRPMMNQMFQNPEYMAMIMRSHPMYQQLMQTDPAMAQLLVSPQVLQQATNPEFLNQVFQMQGAFGGGSPLGGAAAGNTTGTPSTNNAAPSINPSGFSGLNPSFGLFGMQPSSNLPPEQRFSVQLQQLNDMGFNDNIANIQALTAMNGNVNLAIERLLGG